MNLTANLCMKDADGESPGGRSARMKVIVHPDHAHLADLLREGLTNDPGTCVIVDRRCGERRKLSRKVRIDLRKSDRRHSCQQLIEAIIEI